MTGGMLMRTMAPFEGLWEIWTHQFMVRGFMVTLLAALVCAMLSCWLVLVGWSLMGDALSHAVLPGVVLSYVLGAPFSIGALISALVCVGLIGAVRRNTRIKQDAAIGVVFTTMLASGLMLISVFPSQISLEHVLFGDLLGITRQDMLQVLVLAPLAGLAVFVKRRDLTLLAFDPTHAEAIGLSVRRLTALLLFVLALTVVVAMQAVGAVLIVALLIIPGATARLCTVRFRHMLWIAMLVSAVSVTIGVYVSYWFNTASGATVVTAHGLVFAVVYLVAPQGLRSLLAPRRAAARNAGA